MQPAPADHNQIGILSQRSHTNDLGNTAYLDANRRLGSGCLLLCRNLLATRFKQTPAEVGVHELLGADSPKRDRVDQSKLGFEGARQIRGIAN
jgi:hypothetical protein